GPLHNVYSHHLIVSDEPILILVPTDDMRGQVIDSAGGRPIAGAQVSLRTGGRGLMQTTDSGGFFRFDAVPSSGVLTVSAENYLIPEPIEISDGQPETSTDLIVKLDSGRGWRVRVFDHHGRPLPQAAIIAATGNRYRAVARTDLQGRTTVP